MGERLVPDKCEFCGEPTGQSWVTDYNAPGGKVWLCYQCRQAAFARMAAQQSALAQQGQQGSSQAAILGMYHARGLMLDIEATRPEGNAEAAKVSNLGDPAAIDPELTAKVVDAAAATHHAVAVDFAARISHLETDLARKRDECGRLEKLMVLHSNDRDELSIQLAAAKREIGHLIVDNAKLRRELGKAKR